MELGTVLRRTRGPGRLVIEPAGASPVTPWTVLAVLVTGVLVGAVVQRLCVRRSVRDARTENDRLREAEAAERLLQQRLLEFGRALRETLDPTTVADLGLAALGEGLRLDRCYLRLARNDTLDALTAQWSRDGLDDLHDVGTPGSIAAMYGMHQTGSMSSTDVLEDPFFDTDAGRTWQRLTGARGSLTVVVGVDDEPVGVITCLVTEPRPWKPLEVHWAETVAADLGRALAHTRVYAHQAEALRRLEELDKVRDDFVSAVSHELRTPLTSIQGYLEVLLDDEGLTGHQSNLLEVVERNTERLRLLVEDLLALSPVEPSGPESLEQLDLADVVRAATDAVRPLCRRCSIDLTVDIAVTPAPVVGDRAQLARMLRNVLDNAAKFCDTEGSVTVSLHEGGQDTLEITVRDDGIGIPVGDLPSIGRTFFRARNAIAAAAPGTGLGLAIAANVLEAHGGDLSLDSREGEGTTVTLWLPRAPVDRPAGLTGSAERA